MLRSIEEVLEFGQLREILGRYTTCAPGRRAIERLAPSANRAVLEARFALVREAMAYLRAGEGPGFGSLADPQGWLERLAVPGAVLAAQELLDAASLLETSAALKKSFQAESDKFLLLAAAAAAVADFRPLAGMIRRAVLPNGEISDDASGELKRIRAALRRAREKIQQVLRETLRARGQEPGEDYVTLRNDRFVIPVRASDRRNVPGVVHGASASGQTVFVEPLEAIELNNKLVQLTEEEAAEIARILAELTGRLRAERAGVELAAGTIADFDSLFARARFAREFHCTLPEFSTRNRLVLEAVRHPVLEDNLRRQGRPVIPISLALGGEETVMLISGPNTGGKTVALKTVGLAALAAQAGIPVAAERAELPVFDRVLADIGDEQSIAADLSTFSAHVQNLRAMLDAATDRSLVLVDEIGTGTAPEEGSALAIALLEEFRARRSLTLATTHHNRLKAYASATPGVVNAAVEFDEANLRPTYRLLVGVPGVSSGIAIAERLGLPRAAIERARAELRPEAREAAELIAYLHRSRAELDEIRRQATGQLAQLEEERRKLQTEWVERQRKRLAELERSFAEAAKNFEREIARLVGDIKDRELRAKVEKQAGRRLAKARAEAREETSAAVVQHLAESQQDLGTAAPPAERPVTEAALVPGARVRIRGLGSPVVLRRVEGRAAEVQAGPLRMTVPVNDIVAVADDEASAAARAGLGAGGVTVRARPSEEAYADEINVIGCTVEEATRRVDKFLDSAALANKPRVRIIHGHGTGALRRGLAEFLVAHPLVEKISAEDPERGGTAITVVELKS